MLRFYRFLFLAAWAMACPTLPAQKPSALIEEADQLLTAGKAAEAAERYERAGRLRQADPSILIQAGEAWYEVRNYRKAANCLQAATKNDLRFPLAELHYARALKQCGRYEESLAKFKRFAANYNGPGRVAIQDAVRADIQGCEMALQQADQARFEEDALRAELLPPEVNANDQHEAAPLPFTDDVLYFCRLYGTTGPSQLFKAWREDSIWMRAEQASGLPVALRAKFGDGSFSTDGKRFFYTQLEQVPAPHHDIYYIEKNLAGNWGDPRPLRKYINLPETDTKQPCVSKLGDQEYLFFSSNRPGGYGGYDIWYCERPLNSPDMDFCLPKNLGPKVNTAGSEQTPRFDLRSKTLWFSSNGRASLGGLDIFFSQWADEGWTNAVNMGIPYNSPADDFYFFPKQNGRGGFLVSNRMHGSEKMDTLDQDIFEVR
jgi:tetratricopeptide (TPR) repeat protein